MPTVDVTSVTGLLLAAMRRHELPPSTELTQIDCQVACAEAEAIREAATPSET